MLTKNDENKWAKLDGEMLFIREVNADADEVIAQIPSGERLDLILSSIQTVSVY